MRRRVDSEVGEWARATPTLFVQMRVSRMLGFGFALSLAWTGGVSSLIAFFIGLRARGLIRDGGGDISGMRMAWWCIVAGAAGALAGPPVWYWLFMQAAKNR